MEQSTLHALVLDRQRTMGLLYWCINEGEMYGPGQPLYLYESDKGVTEVVLPRRGQLIKKLVADRTRVQFQQPIAIIYT
jgi:pyruvate/2-oxoglutarate dehydrogenase complex dihydrolipoamide acyltransferase (E2) component